jgi:hypothetical protein
MADRAATRNDAAARRRRSVGKQRKRVMGDAPAGLNERDTAFIAKRKDMVYKPLTP